MKDFVPKNIKPPFGPFKAYQLDDGPNGYFVEDVPDTELKKLVDKVNADKQVDKRLKDAVEAEVKYRKTFKKWVEDDGTIHFGKGYEEAIERLKGCG